MYNVQCTMYMLSALCGTYSANLHVRYSFNFQTNRLPWVAGWTKVVVIIWIRNLTWIWIRKLKLTPPDSGCHANIFLYIFGGTECVVHSFAFVAHFIFLRDVWNLNSNPERCRSKQVRYRLSHPSL